MMMRTQRSKRPLAGSRTLRTRSASYWCLERNKRNRRPNASEAIVTLPGATLLCSVFAKSCVFAPALQRRLCGNARHALVRTRVRPHFSLKLHFVRFAHRPNSGRNSAQSTTLSVSCARLLPSARQASIPSLSSAFQHQTLHIYSKCLTSIRCVGDHVRQFSDPKLRIWFRSEWQAQRSCS